MPSAHLSSPGKRSKGGRGMCALYWGERGEEGEEGEERERGGGREEGDRDRGSRLKSETFSGGENTS